MMKSFDPKLKETLQTVANTIRILSMDAVQKADSGHPGLPMGCAEIGAYLWGKVLRYNPKDPNWVNRDRFVLSAGHGSMLLYSALYLTGYDVSLDDLKQFRQLHSKTPGHPESLDTPGVETTTGPLGQGVGNAVGQALALKLLGAHFNTSEHKIFDNKVYFLMGDGCMMEGVSSEASSFAGHLRLNNIVGIYDANRVTLDGPLSESASEDTKKRYEAYGWEVYVIEDGNDLDQINAAFEWASTKQEKPRLLIAHTVIGKGSPNKEGTYKVHGSPLGPEELRATKEALGLSPEPFYVAPEVTQFFKKKQEEDISEEGKWRKLLETWGKANPEKQKEYETFLKRKIPADIEAKLWAVEIKSPVAGRKASSDVINALAPLLPFLYGGSADLSVSDLTMMKGYPIVSPGHFEGRNIKFGVREFAMGTMATGIAETDMILPFVGTFLTFSDYMRNAIRLCSLMKQHVIYQFTHDSIFLGEDGPTHQPIEHYAALRAIPNLHFIRPADDNEVKMAWVAALNYPGPTAFSLSRQNLPTLAETKVPYKDGLGRGAYILRKTEGKPDYTLVATGSEVSLALDVATALEKQGKKVRVISMPCWELFEQQTQAYKNSLFGGDIGKRVSIEAGIAQGWHKYIGSDGIAISMETFGGSAPYKDLAKAFGFTVDAILAKIA